MRIVEGHSGRRRVTLMSDEFMATARYRDNGEISCRVTQRNGPLITPLTQFLKKHRNHMPQLIRLSLLFFARATKKARILFGAYFVGLAILSAWFAKSHPAADSALSNSVISYWWVIPLIFLGALISVNRRVAAWHGAEHMAIAAYERTGLTDISVISQESPVNDACGGRYAIPALVAGMGSLFIAQTLSINGTLSILLCAECFFWIENLVKWSRVPLVLPLSRILQKCLTTRTPGPKELRTAHKALEALVAAHQPKENIVSNLK